MDVIENMINFNEVLFCYYKNNIFLWWLCRSG